MLTLQQLWLILAVDAGVAIAGTLVVAHFVGFPGGDRGGPGAGSEVRRDETRAGPAEATGTWYEEAVSLAREVRQTVSTFDGSTDPDRVSKRLLPLSARIRGHVRSAPSAVDADVRRRLFELGVACQRVAVEGRPAGGPGGSGPLQVRLDALRSVADDLAERAAPAG